MCLATRYLVDLVRNLTNVYWRSLISEGTQAELSILASSTCEESANVVDESGMLGAAVNLLYIRSIVVLKIDQSWTKYDSHAARASITASTLAVVIVSPAVDVSRSAEDH